MSEFNNSKMAVVMKDQLMVDQRNKRNDSYQSYQIARDMYNTMVDEENKAIWLEEMNYWAKELTVRNPARVTNESISLPRSTPTTSSLSSNSQQRPSSRTVTEITQSQPNPRVSTTKQRMNFNDDYSQSSVPSFTQQLPPVVTSEVTIDLVNRARSNSSSDSDSDNESYKQAVVEKAKEQRRKY